MIVTLVNNQLCGGVMDIPETTIDCHGALLSLLCDTTALLPGSTADMQMEASLDGGEWFGLGAGPATSGMPRVGVAIRRWGADGELVTFNAARVRGRVTVTGNSFITTVTAEVT